MGKIAAVFVNNDFKELICSFKKAAANYFQNPAIDSFYLSEEQSKNITFYYIYKLL